MLKEFKAFLMRGNCPRSRGRHRNRGGFGGVVTSFVNDILMPPIGLALGRVDFTNLFISLSGESSSMSRLARYTGPGTLSSSRTPRPRGPHACTAAVSTLRLPFRLILRSTRFPGAAPPRRHQAHQSWASRLGTPE